jgi:uncharacterized repeat protein (TIGR03803 family)
MKKFVFTLLILTTITDLFSQDFWKNLPPSELGSTEYSYNASIVFKGYLYAAGTKASINMPVLRRTPNGGHASWENIPFNFGWRISALSTASLNGTDYLFALADSSTNNGESSAVIRSTDGIHWQAISKYGNGIIDNSTSKIIIPFKGSGITDSLYVVYNNSFGVRVYRTSVDNTDTTNWTLVADIGQLFRGTSESPIYGAAKDAFIWQNKLYVLLEGTLVYTPNGTNWQIVTSVEPYYSLGNFSTAIAFNNSVFIGINQYNGALLIKSNDLNTWNILDNSSQPIVNFNDSAANPTGTFVELNNKLYGATRFGGSGGTGTIYEFDKSTSKITTLKSFQPVSGEIGSSGLISDNNGNLYGLTESGGLYQSGTLYSYNRTQDSLRVLFHFSGNNGANPTGDLVLVGNTIYGTTQQGGQNNLGVFFKFNLSTHTFTKLFDFNDGFSGASPRGGLTYDGNSKIYGVTPNGGEFGMGILYSFNITDSIFNKLYEFNSNFGSYPVYAPVFGSDGFLYGITDDNPNYASTIYRYDTLNSIMSAVSELNPNITGKSPTSKMFLNPANNKFYFGLGFSYFNYSGSIIEFDPVTEISSIVYNNKDYSGTNCKSIYWEGNDLVAVYSDGSIESKGSISRHTPGLPNPLPEFVNGTIDEINNLEEINGTLYLSAYGNTCGNQDRPSSTIFSGCDNILLILKTNTGDLFNESANITGTRFPGRSFTMTSFGNHIYAFGNDYYTSGCIRLCTTGNPPEVNFTPNSNICEGETLTLDAENPGSTYLWSTSETSQTINPINNGLYSVFITGSNGCFGFGETSVINRFKPDSLILLVNGSTTLCNGDTLTASFTSLEPFPNRIRLNGYDGYVSTPNLSNYLFDESYTIELWVKPSGPGVIVTEYDPNKSRGLWNNNQLEIAANGDVYASTSGVNPIIIGNILFNQWSHLAIRYNLQDSTLNGFINGVKSASNSHGLRDKVFGYPYYGALNYWFGKGDSISKMNNSNYFMGRIANIRIWNTAISDSLLETNYNKLLGANNNNLILCYQFTDTTVTVLQDASGNQNNGFADGGVSLVGPSALSYEITPNQGFVSSVGGYFKFNPSVSSTYYINATNEFGCSLKDTLFIFVPAIKISESSLSYCDGSSVIITLDSALAPTWSPTNGLNILNKDSVIIFGNTNQVYTVTDILHNCTVTDSILITVNPIPLVNVFDVTVCKDSKIFMEGFSSLPGIWTPTAGLSDSTSASVLITGVSSGSYQFVSTDPNTGCSGSDSMFVTVNPLPFAEVGGDTGLCENLSLTLDATPVLGNEFVWSSTDPNFNQFLDTIINIPASNNTYYLSVTGKTTGCVNYDTINVNLYITDRVNIITDSIAICSGSLYNIQSTGASTFSWYPPNNLSSITSSSPVITAQNTIWYYLLASDINGCHSSDSIFVKAQSLPAIKGTVKYDSLGTEININKGEILVFYGDTVGALDTLLSIPILNGTYFRDNLPSGLIALLSTADSTIYYPDIPSIYYGGTDNWNNVQAVTASCEDTLNLNIVHTYINPNFLNGTATIDGYLLEGIPFGRPGEPIRGIDIILEDNPGGNNQAFRKTDTTGYFAFQNVPNGRYQIRINIPGRVQDTVNYTFNVNTDGGIIYDSTVVFYFNDTLIFIRDTTFMDTLNVDPTFIKSNTSKLDNFDFTVYPNPSNGLFTLQSVGNTTNLEDILIYDLQGRLLSRRKNINLINNRIILDLRSFQLAKGTYYLKLKHNDNHQLVPIVID